MRQLERFKKPLAIGLEGAPFLAALCLRMGAWDDFSESSIELDVPFVATYFLFIAVMAAWLAVVLLTFSMGIGWKLFGYDEEAYLIIAFRVLPVVVVLVLGWYGVSIFRAWDVLYLLWLLAPLVSAGALAGVLLRRSTPHTWDHEGASGQQYHPPPTPL